MSFGILEQEKWVGQMQTFILPQKLEGLVHCHEKSSAQVLTERRNRQLPPGLEGLGTVFFSH